MHKNFDVVLLDAYGVIWDGKEPINGAAETMEYLRSKGITVGMVSNATLMNDEAEENYAKKGFKKGVHYDFFQTSGETARRMFREQTDSFFKRHQGKKYINFRKPNPSIFKGTDFTETKNLEEAAFVYIGVPLPNHLTADPFMDELKEYKKHNLPLICANPDYKASDTENGKIFYFIRQGGIAKVYEEDLHGEVFWIGKPYDHIYEDVMKNLPLANKDRILFVGDTLRTDIKGAAKIGFKTALTVGTGVTAEDLGKDITLEQMYAENNIVPDYPIDSIASLKTLITMDFEHDKHNQR